jgi:hypothetical protein
LARAVDEIRADGFGLELWLGWDADLKLFERERWGFIKELTAGISAISMHTALPKLNTANARRSAHQAKGFLLAS